MYLDCCLSTPSFFSWNLYFRSLFVSCPSPLYITHTPLSSYPVYCQFTEFSSAYLLLRALERDLSLTQPCITLVSRARNLYLNSTLVKSCSSIELWPISDDSVYTTSTRMKTRIPEGNIGKHVFCFSSQPCLWSRMCCRCVAWLPKQS